MRLTLAVLATLFVIAAPAHAAGPQLGIADDRILLGGGEVADEAVAEWADMGVEVVRIYALWNRIGPSYPDGDYDWTALDHAVDRVVAAGMEPMLNITGPGPLWVSRRSERGEPRYDPDPKLYAEFARAVAERYGDRVSRYILWNEPNLGGWLKPQRSCNRRQRCSPVSPHLYRTLVRRAYPEVHAADPGAQVLIGALGPRGSARRSENANLRPLEFLRAFGCVDKKFKRLRTGRCRNFKPAMGDGFAYHPHNVLGAPERPFRHRDDIALASLSRLTATLDRLQRMRRITASGRRFDLYLDEFGYQTNPPDKLAGISLRQQDQWLQRAAYLAWRNKRVKLFSQYLWRDEPRSLNNTFGGWQSGLRFIDGRPKPALKHFTTPFVLDARRSRLWGHVRRRDAGEVTIERRLAGSSRWRTVSTRTTDAQGYWSWQTRLTKGASYRYRAAEVTSATLKRR
ncbi:MAG TPA: cellulase family glycosylhydrolase [Solirubrobacter sp.]|nr:cellulase family glycosylhydrolase [Solirubrobacter sp.]